MQGLIQEIDELAYSRGPTLPEALFQFTDAELVKAYEMTLNPPTTIKTGQNGFLGMLQSAGLGMAEIQNNNTRREKVCLALQKDILQLIKKGNLIAFGFKQPRNLQDKPIKIPADLFISGEIDWKNSELKSRNFEFTGIRLLLDVLPEIDIRPENENLQEIKKAKNSKSIKSKKMNFPDLDPELHINEKDAAKLLGLSERTLQGYRVKGGGPEFRKIGKKIVRYKIADINEWSAQHKRQNTSQKH